MWIFTKVGMFSVVEATELVPEMGEPGKVLAVRARVARDLDELRGAHAPHLGPTVRLAGRDYPYRAYISKEGFAEVMVRLALDLDYGSFKSMVAQRQGGLRAKLYTQVWSVMHDAERKLRPMERAGRTRSRRIPPKR